ncbi:MAG: PhaM family polyhydroxyalkanoate granule multifunctional regulatory protein [Rhodoferax sp.]
MSSTDTSGFGKFVPGFDFLQNLAKSASSGLGANSSSSAVPNLSQWLVPSLNVEDLEKRIEELKHVQFWLEQNSRALSATIQALEVQKMTMQTLKGMNFTMGTPGSATKAEAAPAAATWPIPPASPPAPEPEASTEAAPAPEPAKAAEEKPASGVVDPLQLWGSLTQQFQTIAANAFKEVREKVATAPTAKKSASKATASAKPVAKKTATKKAVARKAPAKKTASRAASAPTRRRAS